MLFVGQPGSAAYVDVRLLASSVPPGSHTALSTLGTTHPLHVFAHPFVCSRFFELYHASRESFVYLRQARCCCCSPGSEACLLWYPSNTTFS